MPDVPLKAPGGAQKKKKVKDVQLERAIDYLIENLRAGSGNKTGA